MPYTRPQLFELSKKIGRSWRTLQYWAAQGCDLNDPESVKAFLEAKELRKTTNQNCVERAVKVKRSPSVWAPLLKIPRKIHDKIGQQNATEIVDWLSVRAQNADQIEFLDLVSDLLEEYESQFSKDPSLGDPLELLRYLVKENGISTRELGKILKVDHSVAARILKGERSITIEHAKNLGARFKTDPRIFLKF